jgi:hypothetical protein
MTSGDIAQKTGASLRTANKWAAEYGVEYTGEGRRKTYVWTEDDLNQFIARPPKGRPVAGRQAMSEKTWGGKRPNQTGRPPIEDKRTIRGLAFNTAEWTLIKSNAERRGLSIREYLFSLVEKDA